MPRRIPLLILTALLVSGCGGSGGSGGAETTKSPPADDSAAKPSASRSASTAVSAALVTWMGDWCAAEELLEFPAPLSIPATTTEADREPVKEFLEDSLSTLTKTKNAAAKLGAAPSADAKSALADYREDVGDMHKETAEARTKASVYPAHGLASLYRLTAMEQVTREGILGHLDGHPDLKAAYKQSPDC